ncbi:UNVERIFIED_CONTAM: Transcriptional activator DEMETER [Sesamum latifolium]|uniref:Transcriptional activator DEMETER n=1 Tax=Sesamum latifolium TaxID=2727402 RepID=A0AAW2TAG0_9LAMI
MNLGKGFSVPWEKGVMQNGEIWIPATPEKPVLQRANSAVSEMPETRRGEGNWQDLLGIYTGLLQNEAASGRPQKFNPNVILGPNGRERSIQGVAPVETYNRLQQNYNPTGVVPVSTRVQSSRDVAPVGNYNRLPWNFNPSDHIGINIMDRNIQDVRTLQNSRRLNQNVEGVGSSVQNVGEPIPPQKVNSLAELMGMRSATRAPPPNLAPNESTYVVGRPTSICLHSQGERNQTAYASVGGKHQQNHILHASGDGDGYNLHEMPNSRLAVPCWPDYNINIRPRLEARESSSASRTFPLGPVTPDQQKQPKNYQTIQVPSLLIDETSTRDKDKQDTAVLSAQPQILERERNEFSFNTLGRPTGGVLTSPKEKNNAGGENGGIDLNETPPQKPPKRRKHRPKVVVEGKPKRTPKPAAKKSSTPDENPTTKRKYERRNGSKTSTSPSIDAVNVVEASNMEPAKRSCKRVLNFDLDNGEQKENQGRECDYQAQDNEGSKLPFNLNLDSHIAERSKELNEPSASTVKVGQEKTCGKEIQWIETACDFVPSNIPPLESTPVATTAPPPLTSTLNIIARSLNVRNASMNQSSGSNRYSQVHNPISGGLAQLVIQANTIAPNLECRRQSTIQTTPQLLEDLVNVTEQQASKREHSHPEQRQPHAITLMGSQLWSHGVSATDNCDRGSSKLLQNSFETGKKKMDEKFHATSSSMPSGITAVDNFSRQIESRRNMIFPAQSSRMHQNSGLTNSDSKELSNCSNSNDKLNMVSCDWYTTYPDFRHKFQQQPASSQVHLCAERMAQNKSNLGKEKSTNSLTAVTNWNLESASQRDPKSIPPNEIIHAPDRVAVKRRAAGQTSSNKLLIADKCLQQESKNSRSYGHSSKKVTGSEEENRTLSYIDDIADRMKELRINDKGKGIERKEQTALVPYRRDGAIVPFEEFDPVKKRKPRPRVDLDPETNRLWNLLMGKEGSASAETMETDKQKWWEDERKVFRGRVDSFIARMHLVQGDRRFSKWKGSVVDSVIGVFLTQNVSDHLSSYPVLESIQKYLWPRLCKLDQETLYELHYQMITFGKVFCTKREPNCNACPMRGECRHFASAFASARLALPGPEGRQMTSSAFPYSARKSSEVIIKPIALPASEDNIERGTGLTRNSEPFIEEPTTPEPPTEVSEKDIEDAFYEDPDEIPVIKLNVEEFTTNLQSFMQEQMEVGEGDMSKALVALSPELASIPMPKLKHVSRLRTEHQVYELPDSHPLLKGMDRREPDDPSPYLLAIWTPGFVCVRGFDQKTRAPRPLKARLHLPASKMAKQNE